MRSPLPFEAVAFDAATVLDLAGAGPGGPTGPAGARPRRGAIRLVAALTRRGLAVTVHPPATRPSTAPTSGSEPVGAFGRNDLETWLDACGLSAVGARAAGGPAAGMPGSGPAAATIRRTLAVTGPLPPPGTDPAPGRATGAAPGTIVVALQDGEPVHLAVLRAVAARPGSRPPEPSGPATVPGTGQPSTGQPNTDRAGAGRPGADRAADGAGREARGADEPAVASPPEAGPPGASRDAGGGPVGAFEAAAALVAPLHAGSVRAAEERQARLTKPPGSLGRLEAVGCRLAGIAAESPPPAPRPATVAVFAGDHGVHAQGVSPWPQEVTAQMVANFVAGGAAINVLARHAGADVVVVDVGVATPVDAACAASPRYRDRRVRAGTADLSVGPAMSRDDARAALDVGAETALRLVAGGTRCLVTGDMGIANTTPAAALVAALTERPAPAVTGRGTGVDDDVMARKVDLVAQAADRARHRHGDDALGVLAEVGGLEHAALAGFVVGAAAAQVPVVIDGVIATAGLLVASRLVPGVEAAVLAGHRSVEPGASAVLAALGLDPMVDLGLRLGEGTGAALALPLVEAAALVLNEMATFDQAGVTDKAT